MDLVLGARSASAEAGIGHPSELLNPTTVSTSDEQRPLDILLAATNPDSEGGISDQQRGPDFHGAPHLRSSSDVASMDVAMFPNGAASPEVATLAEEPKM